MNIDTYSDIIGLSRPPVPLKHPQMDVLNRAKIFAPFAALRGFEERIDEEGRRNTQERRYSYETQGCGTDEYYPEIYTEVLYKTGEDAVDFRDSFGA